MMLGAWRLLLAATMIVMTVSVGLGVVSRYVFNAPFFWTEEVARYALVFMTFLGSAELFRLKAGHIKVEILINTVSPRLRRAMDRLSDLVVLAILVVMVAGGIVFVEGSRWATSAALGLPMYLIYAVIPASAAIGILLILRRLLSRDDGEDA